MRAADFDINLKKITTNYETLAGKCFIEHVHMTLMQSESHIRLGQKNTAIQCLVSEGDKEESDDGIM